jgi:hypothetical protein
MSTDNQENNDNAPVNPDSGTSHENISPKVKANKTTDNQIVNHRTTAAKKKKTTIVKIVSVPQKDNTEAIAANTIAKGANTISIWAVAVNIFLFLITLALAYISYRQYKSSDDAAKTANLTLAETRKFNSTTLANQKISDRKSDSLDRIKSMHDDSVFEYQKKSLNAQIDAIKENQKEFEIENRPFIAIANIIGDTPIINRRMNYSAYLANTGKQPAFIISTNYQFITTYDSTYTNMDNIPKIPGIEHSFVTNHELIPVLGNSSYIANKETVEYSKSHPMFTYFRGIIAYRGITKNKKYLFKFIYRNHFDKYGKLVQKTVYYFTD